MKSVVCRIGYCFKRRVLSYYCCCRDVEYGMRYNMVVRIGENSLHI
jgi:hypothetical protein